VTISACVAWRLTAHWQGMRNIARKFHICIILRGNTANMANRQRNGVYTDVQPISGGGGTVSSRGGASTLRLRRAQLA